MFTHEPTLDLNRYSFIMESGGEGGKPGPDPLPQNIQYLIASWIKILHLNLTESSHGQVFLLRFEE